ncbi:MAG: NAD(P)/FAD-dependent oxidoreductase [Opitutus sp.]
MSLPLWPTANPSLSLDFGFAVHDVCIVGVGPAGLNAALILGRCGRDVLVVDSGRPRNGVSPALHGFLSRDGTPPLELRELGRAELGNYPTITLRQNVEVHDVRRHDRHFEIFAADGTRWEARKLLLATGRIDLIPRKPGFREHYGLGVYHCPYCDCWEHRDQTLAAYASGTAGFDLAIDLLIWTRKVTLCTDGPRGLSEEQRTKLEANGVTILESPVDGLRGGRRTIAAVVFEDQSELPCDAVFFCSDCVQKSPFAQHLGCQLDETGSVMCDEHAATAVPGLYVAGNVRRGVRLAIVAAAEGAEAGMAINNALHDESLR